MFWCPKKVNFKVLSPWDFFKACLILFYFFVKFWVFLWRCKWKKICLFYLHKHYYNYFIIISYSLFPLFSSLFPFLPPFSFSLPPFPFHLPFSVSPSLFSFPLPFPLFLFFLIFFPNPLKAHKHNEKYTPLITNIDCASKFEAFNYNSIFLIFELVYILWAAKFFFL